MAGGKDKKKKRKKKDDRGHEQQNKRAHHPVDSSHPLKVILHQIAEADCMIKVLLPPLDTAIDANWNKSLLAHRAAKASRVSSSGQMRQGVCKVVKLATIKEVFGHVVLQPQYLWDLHLDAHLAADIAQQIVACGIDLLGFSQGSVVQPQYHVAIFPGGIRKVWPGNRNRLISVVAEYCEGACGIES